MVQRIGVWADRLRAKARITNEAYLKPMGSQPEPLQEIGDESQAATPGDRDHDLDMECLVTLQQAAAMVSRSKRTLERKKVRMPLPRVEGGGGKPAEWAWSELRPWLEKEFGRPLPEKFPADRFRP